MLRNVGKDSVRKRSFRGSGGLPPQENLGIKTSEIASAVLLGQVSVAEIIHITSIQEALSLLFSSQERV